VKTESLHPNRLTLRIQPEEGITFKFLAKVPGPELEVREVGMAFNYEESFMVKPAEAYIRLVHDAMEGDPTLFVRQDEIERSWAIVQPIIDNPSTILPYKAGEWGPWEADKLAPGGWYLR
jgi:glucose-6-phosphate 1-dehydrogenase